MATSFNGFGSAFYGQRDFRNDGSHLTTEWVILAYFPFVPMRSLRVIPDRQKDQNLIVYTSSSFVVVETLPCDRNQVLCVYGFVLLCICWAVVLIRSLIELNGNWPNHAMIVYFLAVILGIVPMILPWYLRWRVKRDVVVTAEAVRQTVSRLVRPARIVRSEPPPLPQMPAPSPSNDDERYKPRSSQFVTIAAVLKAPTKGAIETMFDDKDAVFWVDWREDDGAIAKYCEGVLHTGNLAAAWVDSDSPSGCDLYISYKASRNRVPLVSGHEDRHITLCALNRVLAPEFQIRFCIDSNGSDTLAFVALPSAEWSELERRFGPAVSRHFYLFGDHPNLFTDPLPCS